MSKNDHPNQSQIRMPTKPLGLKPFQFIAKRKNVPFTGDEANGTEDDMFNGNTITTTLERELTVTSTDSTGPANGNSTSGGCGLPDYVNHIAGCLMVDTLDLQLEGTFSATPVKLDSSFVRRGIDEELVDDSSWDKGSIFGQTGKRSLRARHVGKTKTLTVEGSSAMHNQGQNVVSSGNVTMAAFSMFRAVNKYYGLGLPDHVGNQIAHGQLVEVSRIDVSLLLRVPDGITKSALINTLALAGFKAGTNTSLYVNESVYFDQNSQLEAEKIYDKQTELNRARKGGLDDIEGGQLLVDLNEKTLRLEAVFRKKRLVQIAAAHGGRPHPRLFTTTLLAEMVLGLLKKHSFSGQVFRRLENQELLAIPLPYRSTVAHWQNHMNLRDMVVSDRVLKEQAAYIWTNHKINILGPQPDEMNMPMSLSELLSPINFMPVPAEIRANPTLFFEMDMDAVRANLGHRVGSGISGVIISPYRSDDE